ncbi:MAG: lytic murein transglycosylase [Alphaproteobacteria bacterium]
MNESQTEFLLGRRAILAAGAAVAAVLSWPRGVAANDFQSWLADFRREAKGLGISDRTLDAAFVGVEPIPRIIELDRKQPEFALSFDDYIGRVVSQARIERGRQLLSENKALLDKVTGQYPVQPRFVVALWGIESDFGRLMGTYSVVAALATLAFDGRRSAYFRRELLDALRIIEDGHVAASAMKGSWAGAMGQSQFMPSSFVRFAVDFDGDGRRDIWGSRADVFASAANYLSRSGWQLDQTWGREVHLPNGFDGGLVGHAVRKPLGEWHRLGVRRADGGMLPARDMAASVLRPAGANGPAFLVYENFRVILKWNRSDFFGLAVGRLADSIDAA